MKDSPLILVVDDEEDIRTTVECILKDENFLVETAVDGSDCIKKLKKIKPDLVILDILMPGLTTKEIIKRIRKLHPKLPIIFLTVVKLTEATKKKLINSHVADYIEKPFDNFDLLKRIKSILK